MASLAAMPDEDELFFEAMRAAAAKQNRLPARTQLTQDSPAPHLNHMIAERGRNATRDALEAWDRRIRGEPITDIAHHFGLSIEGARILLREAHDAVHEDLKDNLEQNRALDLARVDGLLRYWYPAAQTGDEKAATVTIKCLQHRAKLTGLEIEQAPARINQPQNVLVWIQQQMPSISRLVESLPVEEAPGAPS